MGKTPEKSSADLDMIDQLMLNVINGNHQHTVQVDTSGRLQVTIGNLLNPEYINDEQLKQALDELPLEKRDRLKKFLLNGLERAQEKAKENTSDKI